MGGGKEILQLNLGLTVGDEEKPASAAVFSPCRRYRFELWRRWGVGAVCSFICLNPSTADETKDDPTVRRCIRYAKKWGFGSFCMLNLFAFRATDPEDMKAEPEPVGEGNDDSIRRVAGLSGLVVAGWGVHGEHLGRAREVLDFVPGLHALGLTKGGLPRHPLYLRKDAEPFPLEGTGE